MVPHIWKLMDVETIVNIFDKSTWKGVDYDGICNILQMMVVMCTARNQHTEDHVQLLATGHTTNVGKPRGAVHRMIHSYLVWLHKYSLSIVKKKAKVEDGENKRRSHGRRTRRRYKGLLTVWLTSSKVHIAWRRQAAIVHCFIKIHNEHMNSKNKDKRRQKR